ncbi:MAG TPA: cobalamin-binding protein [Nitrospira sp.]|nr:cobalamin-binding protein [Nitrospira sp.]
MRICSLVPGATEVVVSLGLGEALVGISHECDYPETVRHVPVMVQAAIDSDDVDSAAIDRQVKSLMSSGQPLYRLDEWAFHAARPDIILAQDICHVCAITPQPLERVVHSLSPRPQLVTLAPHSLTEVLDDVERIGAALGVASRGIALAQSLRSRIAAVRKASAGRSRPRVICLEWLDPLYVGGHWVPEMVEIAGGHDALGHAGQPSRGVTMEEVLAATGDIIIAMPCGFSVSRTVSEVTTVCRRNDPCSHLLRSAQTYAVDAASYFSRPGPRLVDGVELLADIFTGAVSGDRSSDSVVNLTGTLCLTGQSL